MPPKSREDLVSRIVTLETNYKNIKEVLDNVVHKDEFSPVKSLVYGFAALMLASLVAAIVGLVIKH